ncbi:MAG: methylmalonyl-CoA mutase family protein, partial [Dehalococcoidia bacterium]|nr:methylmalonyl-CoA mutase family protein [Dehalococcoidia bacterium]
MARSKKDWEDECLKPALKRPLRQESFATPSGIPVDTVYTLDDADDCYEESLGYPGEYPYTRGIQPTMYRGRLWTMRQYAGFGSAEESNRRYRYLLDQGQTGLSVAFDLPTQIGYDSDEPASAGEVGKVGVPISSIEDMETLFRDIPLDKVSTSMTINATAPILLAMYIALARRRGLELKGLDGTVQNDVLKEYIARGTHIFPPRPSMRLTTDIFDYCSREAPRWNTISISGYHIREAGSTATQEVAFTLGNAMAYVQGAVDRGLDVDSFAGRLSFFFACHNNFIEEIAKFRAARRMWAKIIREHFGAKDPRSWTMRFHTQTGGVTLTAQQPLNNVVRTTIQALAAVLGGTQSLHTNSWDEAYAPPSEEAVTIALRTQQVIAHESGVADIADPLGGSFFLEALTSTIEKEAFAYIDKIHALGGAVTAIEQGFQQKEIQDSSYTHQQQVESGQRVQVGVNQFVTAQPAVAGLLKMDPEKAHSQIQRLRDLRERRSQAAVSGSLQKIESTARTDQNLMPALVEAVEVGATLGEICGVLRQVFGT